MDWNLLLNEDRFRKHSQKRSELDARSEFDDDYSRLVFSSAVRRLQDKAQVFPLDNSDYVRTRLTHSMEVSAIARSIGVSVENRLIEEHKLNEKHRGKLGTILATVGLVHDVGNPPYGHFGERAIQEFFEKWFYKHPSLPLSDVQKQDLLNFEGNAQGFRSLRKLNFLVDENSFNLTFATLSSLIKYPRSSVEGNITNDRISYKKFGYFQAEEADFKRVAGETGIYVRGMARRHPLAFC